MNRLGRLQVLAAAGCFSVGIVVALPVVEQEARLKLTVHILPVDGSSTGTSLGERSLEMGPGGRVEAEIDLPWPDGNRGSRLRLRSTGSPGEPGGEHDAVVESWLALPDGREIHSARGLKLREGTTRFLEIYGDSRQKLILAVQAERITRSVVRAGPEVGRPVRFRLEIERAEGERSVSLETNVLDTFVGQGVSYSFERGEDQDLESLRIVLTPLRLLGEVAEVEVRVVGRLPGSPGRVDRAQRLVTTRGSTSSFTVATGPYSSGYRFLITPDF